MKLAALIIIAIVFHAASFGYFEVFMHKMNNVLVLIISFILEVGFMLLGYFAFRFLTKVWDMEVQGKYIMTIGFSLFMLAIVIYEKFYRK